jgi:hypothetical protein
MDIDREIAIDRANDYLQELEEQLEQYKRALGLMFTVMSHYADPESYHGMAVLTDCPARRFSEDWAEIDHEHYEGSYGAAARRVLDILRRRYGDLTVVHPPGALVEVEEEDVVAMYGVDCEKELTRLLVEEIERTRNE